MGAWCQGAVRSDMPDRDETTDEERGFAAPPEDRAEVDRLAGNGASGYGEITAVGVRRLLSWLRLRPEDQFFDLGSGVGRLVMQVAAESEAGRVVGVELSHWRHHEAELSLEVFRKARPEPARRVELRHGDLRSADLSGASVIYLGATCFPPELLAVAGRRIADHAPALRRLLTTRALPDPVARRFVEVGQLDLEMTWSAAEAVFVYEAPR